MMKPVGVFKATLLLQLIPQPCLPALCCLRPACTTRHSLSVGASHRRGSHELGMGECRPALCCLLPACTKGEAWVQPDKACTRPVYSCSSSRRPASLLFAASALPAQP